VQVRTEEKAAGIAYLGYIVFAASSAMLSGRTMVGSDLPQMLSTLSRMIGTARVTVLLDLLQIVCAIVLAATLYRLTKAVDPTIALLAMLFRTGEGLLGFLPLLDKLELMRIATDPAVGAANALSDPALVREIMDRPTNNFDEFCFIVGGFLFAYLFLRGRLIPRWLAWVGVVTIGAQLVCVPLGIATIVPKALVNWLWFPILLYEVPLGIWLIARGRESRHAFSSAD
jgi:hypothetical protein